jgi:RNA polymerase-interacting CarD/CdnL/TRCF family regulator
MVFQIGDKVIHKHYGLGEVIQLDEKEFSGRPTRCYVVRIRDLTMWVPAEENIRSSLRLPTPRDEFEKLFAILRSSGEPLSNDRFERKTQLYENMKDGKLEGICRVIRDLTLLGVTKKLNVDDRSVLERAQSFLVNEWMLSFSVSQIQAQRELSQILGS